MPFFANAASAATQVRFPPAASLGDYVLSLNCTSPCGATRKETVVVAVFEAHETGRTGATVRTRPVGPFDCPNLGTPVTPKGLWRFDGDGSNDVPGGQAAEVVILAGTAQPNWSAEGKFGGGVDLRCVMAGDCHYLKFGNPETTPWSAICVSYWFWTVKELKNTYFTKGASFTNMGPGWFTYTTHEWHHYVFCQDEQIYKWYKDGVLERMEHGRSARTAADAADFMSIGQRSGHPSYGFNGTLDDLAVYDFILSNDEVEQIYTNGAASFTERLCGDPYWHGGYSTGFIREWFPNLTDATADYAGYFKANPHVTPLTSYVHPRLFFGPEDLNALRVKFRTVDAARTAYESLKSRLHFYWYSAPLADIATRNLTYDEFTANSIQDLMLQAFRCLIDHDRVMAERLGEQLESLAREAIAKAEAFVPDYDTWEIQGSSYDTTDIWRIPQHDYVLRLALAFGYDFLYPLLATSTRELLRSALAKVTQGVWSVGMRAYGPSTSNWHSWVTGDLVLNLIAIYGEDGFDEGVYEAATESFRAWTQTGVSMTSGASFEGGGKNGLGGSKLMAMALHGQPQYLASQGALKFVRSFLLHTMLPNGHWFEDDLWGSIEAKPLIGDVAPFKHAYPNDKVIDYVYRMVVDGGRYATASVTYKGVDLPYREYTATRHSVYTYNNFIMDVIYAADFSGPSNITEHGMAMADQPLAYAATDRGMMVARSAWGDENAAWLLLNIRSQPGGHATPARGEFCFYALGQVWAFYHTGHNYESWKHSVVHVDGVGQLGHRAHEPPGIFLAFNDSQEATFASVDMIYPYTDAPWGHTTPNTFHLEPGPHKWQGMASRLVPHWYQGVLASLDIESNGKLDDFKRALRTAGLVRAVKPYALILDDFKKNDNALIYEWRMPLQPHSKVPNRQDGYVDSTCVTYSVGGAGLSIAVSGSDAVLPAVDGGSARLLVRLLPGSSAGAVWSVTAETASCAGQYLLSTLNGTEARFRVLLYPLEAGEALPTTTWDAVTGVLSLTRAGAAGADEITLAVSASGLTSAASVRLASA